MQIVIDISENEYEAVKLHPECFTFANSILNGAPLPKGHGRLIDADALIHWHRFESKSDYDIANAPTIIEADKEN